MIPHNLQNILIIRQHNQLGDMLTTTPTFRAIKEKYPDSYITVVASPENYSVILNNPHINEVLVYDKKSLRNPINAIKFLNKLRSRKYDIAIVLGTVSFSTTSAILAFLSGAKFKIGFDSSFFGKSKYISKLLFNSVVKPNWNDNTHQVDRSLSMCTALGINPSDRKHIIRLTESEKEKALQEWNKLGLNDGSCVIGIHPGAGKIPNRWSAKNFGIIADWLMEQKINNRNVKVIAMCGPKEKELIAEMKSVMKYSPIIIDDKSIREASAIIQLCSLFICNDTGVLHISAGVGTPTLAFFGPTNPKHWNPIGDTHFFIKSDGDDINTISTDCAIEKLKEIIDSAILNF